MHRLKLLTELGIIIEYLISQFKGDVILEIVSGSQGFNKFTLTQCPIALYSSFLWYRQAEIGLSTLDNFPNLQKEIGKHRLVLYFVVLVSGNISDESCSQRLFVSITLPLQLLSSLHLAKIAIPPTIGLFFRTCLPEQILEFKIFYLIRRQAVFKNAIMS